MSAAPTELVAAGFGDMLGKYTALADWKLGKLLWDEAYDDDIAERVREALESCVEVVDGLGRREVESVGRLMYGLIESGLAIADLGGSQPASGSEHHVSHYLEMKLHREGRQAVFHGAKVGAAVTHMAAIWDEVGAMDRHQVERRLSNLGNVRTVAEESRIDQLYGGLAPKVFEAHKGFLEELESSYVELQERILASWDEVQQLAGEVPPADELARLMERAGGTADFAEIGFGHQEVEAAVAAGHYLRPRFTVAKLAMLLGLLPMPRTYGP
jgi:glycerol-1-phosphate dehydrogenase [NAD(P)+]